VFQILCIKLADEGSDAYTREVAGRPPARKIAHLKVLPDAGTHYLGTHHLGMR
jgi:hypothetical protein